MYHAAGTTALSHLNFSPLCFGTEIRRFDAAAPCDACLLVLAAGDLPPRAALPALLAPPRLPVSACLAAPLTPRRAACSAFNALRRRSNVSFFGLRMH